MRVKLTVDGREVKLNEFVNQMLGGMIAGGVVTLKGVEEDWKVIEIEIKKISPDVGETTES